TGCAAGPERQAAFRRDAVAGAADGLVPLAVIPMQRRLYSLLLYLVLVPAMLRQWWRGWRDASQRDSVRARLALGLEPRADSPLWLHAASVGELRALVALLHVMQAREPVLITSSTPTGLARARALFEGKGYAVQAAPWDLPGATRRFIARMRP